MNFSSTFLSHNFQVASWTKDIIGGMLARSFPARRRAIYRRPTSDPTNAIDRGILFHLKKRAVRNGRSRFLQRLHSDFWAGKNGSIFSTNCDHRFQTHFLSKQQADFNALSHAWQTNESVRNIIEIGTCSGLLLQYLNENLDGIESIVGIDINETQISENQRRHANTRLQFLHANGIEWVIDNAKPGTMLVTNGGVLEYFTQRDVESLFQFIGNNAAPSIVYCSEPISADFDLDQNRESIPFGEELSFSHNYPMLLTEAGFTILNKSETCCEGYRMLTTLAIRQL